MTTTNCGDTCGLIDFTMAVAGDRLLPEEKMKLAIEAVTSGKMSQRAAAAKYGVVRRTLARHLDEAAQMRHPTKTQPTTKVSQRSQSAEAIGKDAARLERQRRRKAIRQLAKQHGISSLPSGVSVGQAGHGQIYQALVEQGITVPSDVLPSSAQPKPKAEPKAKTAKTAKSTKSTPPVPTHDTSIPERLSPNDHVPAQQCDGSGEADPSADPIYDEELNIDAVRDHVCAEVQLSDRPADFKRAIELLRELDAICTDAWYRRHPEPWNHHDWAHVNSELKTIQSLVGQRAQETADQLLFPGSAVTVNATAVA